MATPVVLVASGGIAVSEAASGIPLTPVADGGFPVTVVLSGGLPIQLVNFDGSAYISTPAAPVNTGSPAISAPNYYTGTTLTANRGSWTGSPAPTYTYQWKRDGVNIASATATTYVLVSADETKTITFTVTATNTEGSASATSPGILAAAVPVESSGYPVFTSSASQTVAENAAFSLTLTTDISSTFSVVGGADAALFDLTGSSVDAEGFDYETPLDVGGNNVYNITVRATSVTDPSKTTDQAITITVTDVSDAGTDDTPSAFTFTDVTGATVSTDYTSNTITVAGIDTTSAISITGGTYSKNGGGFTSSTGTVVVGDTVAVKVTSSGSNLTAVNAVLTIGGVSDTYTVTTEAAAVTASAFNPSAKGADIALSGSDLIATMSGSPWQTVKSLTGHSSGKWYYEFTITNNGSNSVFGGLADAGASTSSYLGDTGNGVGFFGGNFYNNGFSGGVSVAATTTTGTVFGLAVDMDAKKVWVVINGTVVSGDPVAGTGAHATWSASYTLYGAVTLGNSGGIATATATHSPPTGYTAWG